MIHRHARIVSVGHPAVAWPQTLPTSYEGTQTESFPGHDRGFWKTSGSGGEDETARGTGCDVGS